MRTANTTTVIATAQKIQAIDITQQVSSAVYHSGIKNGIVTIFCRHTTAAVVINECEPGDHHAFTNTGDEDWVLLDFKINAGEDDIFWPAGEL